MKQSIINQCLQGDRRAYKELYNETLPYIIYLCRRYHIKDDVLEDMLQEIYSDMFVALGKYDPNKAPFIQWFRKIGLNRIFKSFRTHNFETVSIEPLTLKLADSINEVDEVEESIIQKLVDQLPIGYKTIFNLSTDGYDYEEISNYLGISKSTSRSQLARAKKILRNQISQLKYSAQ